MNTIKDTLIGKILHVGDLYVICDNICNHDSINKMRGQRFFSGYVIQNMGYDHYNIGYHSDTFNPRTFKITTDIEHLDNLTILQYSSMIEDKQFEYIELDGRYYSYINNDWCGLITSEDTNISIYYGKIGNLFIYDYTLIKDGEIKKRLERLNKLKLI